MKIKYLYVFIILSFIFSGVMGFAQESKEQNEEIEEVIVTAQKRTENLKDVPIAISVFNKEAIEHSAVQELRDLSGFIPNIQISQGTDNGAKIIIRGVGANARNIGFDTRVGVYLDGVYLGQGPALNIDLADMDHVEVLRGPQGTLFGKNTVAGAISLISKKPGKEFSSDVTFNAMNFNGVEAKAILNIPISETVSTRISFSHRKRDGFVKNIYDESHVPTSMNFVHPEYGVLFGVPLPGPVGPNTAPDTSKDLNNVNTQSYRIQLRIQPNDFADINLAVDGLQSDRFSFIGEPLTDTFGSTLDHFAPEVNEVSFSETPTEQRDILGVNLNVDYMLGNEFTVRSITAYRNSDVNYRNDTDTSALDFLFIQYDEIYKQTTQELQLISPDAANLKYVLGFYYYNQDAYSHRDAETGNAGWLFGLAPGEGAFSEGTVETQSYALFMNGSYKMNDMWNLGFGFRYSDETKDVNWHLDGSRSGVFGIGTTPAGGLVDSRSDTHFAPTMSLNYAYNSKSNLYLKYSSGYKSGGYNLDYITQADLEAGTDFDKETVNAYELGLKTRILDNRMTLNFAAFLNNYEDYQVNQFFDLGFDPASGTQLTSIRISNAAKVDTSGLEIETTYKTGSDMTISASLGILDAVFDDFPGGTSVEVPDATVPGGVRKDPVNAAGNRLPLASDVTASLSIQKYVRLESIDKELLFRIGANHIGDYYTTIENEATRSLTGTHGATFTFDIANYGVPYEVPYGKVEAYTTINARMGLLAGDGTWEISLWGLNLTDEQTYVDYFRDFFGSLSATPLAPRTFGIEASYHF